MQKLNVNFSESYSPSGRILTIPPTRWIKLFVFVALAVIFFLKAKDMTVFERYYTNRRFDGDQRKYIRLVQSLAEDFDLDLSNIWYSREEMEEAAVEILATGTRKFGDLYLLGRDGGIYTLHLPSVFSFFGRVKKGSN